MLYDHATDGTGDLDTDAANPPRQPAKVPAKFWDAAKGEIRTDALLRAYLDLERRASAMARPPAAVPAGPEQYRIASRHPALTSDPAVNQRLHQAGFSQDQAQLVYDLAHERLLPMMAALEAAGGGNPADLDAQLCQHFGGEERWRQIAPQLAAWGRKTLPPDIYRQLAGTPEGVKTLHRLMTARGEPSLGRAPSPKDEPMGEDQLKKMVQDPRYWKTKDPAFIAKVTGGYRRLYGD